MFTLFLFLLRSHSFLRTMSKFSFINLIIISTLTLFDATNCASFYGSSHVSFPVQESRTFTKISFRFRSRRENGLFLLTSGSADYVLVVLEDGLIKVRCNLGSGEAWLTSNPAIKLNDNQWHEVLIERLNVQLKLSVNSTPFRTVEVPGDFSVLNVKEGLLVGGLSQAFLEQDDLVFSDVEPFRGCIERLKYNGLDIIESAFAVKDGVKNVDFDCSSEFDANNDQAVTFLDGGSFLNIGDFDGKMSSRNGASFELDIKTSSMTAIVVYIPGAVTSPASFLAVEVLNGRVGLSTNDGGGVVVLMSDIIVNDGYWHRIRVIFSAAYMEVTVDGKTRTLSPSSSERKFYDLSDNLYFGGIEPNREFEALQQGLNSILSEGLEGSSLIGCLRRIEVNRHVTGLKEARNTRGLRSAGCGWDFVCLLHEPCIPEADCFQEGLDDFHCLCDLDTSCVRANFTRGRVQDGGSSSYGPVPGMRLDGGHNEKRNRKGKGRKKDRVNGSPRAHSPATTGRPTVTDQSPILDKVGPKFTLFDSLMNKEQLVMATVGVTITLVVILIVILFREFCFTGNRKSRQGSSGRTGTGTMSSPMPIESDFNDLATISSRQGMSSSHAASPAPSLETDSCLGSSNAGTGSAIRSLGSPGLFAARDERTGRLIVADRRQRESSVIYPLPPPSLYFGHEPNPISGTGSGHADHYCGYNQNSKPMSLFKPYSNNSNEPSCGTLGRHRPKPAYGQVQNGGHFQLAERALGDGVSSSTGSESQLPSLRRVPWSCEDLYRSHGQGSNQDGGYGPSDLECSSDVGKNSRTFAPINSRQQQQFEPIVPNHRTFQTFSPLTPMPAKRQHYWV